MIKLAVSLGVWFTVGVNKERAFNGFTAGSTIWMMVSAFAYSINNMVLIYVLHRVKLPIYAVIKESAILFVGLFWSFVFNVELKFWRWISFILIICGCVLVHSQGRSIGATNSQTILVVTMALL